MLLTNKNIYEALEYTDKLRNEGKDKDKGKGKDKHKDVDKDKGSDKDKLDDVNKGKDEDQCIDKDKEKHDSYRNGAGDDDGKRDRTQQTQTHTHSHTQAHDRALRAVVDKRLTLLAQARSQCWCEAVQYPYNDFHDYSNIVIQFCFVLFFSEVVMLSCCYVVMLFRVI